MNRRFKKTVCAVLAAISVMATLTTGSFAANQKLEVGNKTEVDAKKTVSLEFSPKESGDYMFYSSGDKKDNPYASLYISESGELKKIGSGDDNEKSSNFEIYATLKKGKKYVLKCNDSSRIGDKKYTVSVKKSPVKSISFKPYEPIKICQNDRAYGKYKTVIKDGKSVKYFEYNLTKAIFKNGNKITVNYNNGKKPVTFDYGYHEIHSFSPGWNGSSCDYIYGSEKAGITLDDSKVKITTTQSKKTWDKTGTYYATLTVFGKSVKIPVMIEKSPVSKVEYFPAEKIDYIEKKYDLGQFVEYSEQFNLGDRLKVTYNDKRGTVEYIFSNYSEDGLGFSGQTFVEENDIAIFNVIKTKAAKGSDGKYYSKVSYLGKSINYKYNFVSASDVKISFSSENPLTVAENDVRFGYNKDWGEKYFVYNIWTLFRAAGNTITVTDKKSTSIYSYDENLGEYISKEGYRINEYEISDNQEESHWKTDGKNYIILKVYGKTCKIPVKVIKCSHKNTTTIKAVSPTCKKNGWTNGEYCNTCHAYISGHEVVYGGHKTKPEFKWVGNKAYVTIKCTVCKKTVYKDNERIGNETAKVTQKATTKKDGELVRKAEFFFGSEKPYYAKKTEKIKKIDSITLSKTSLTYNGKTQKPSVTVKDSGGKTLKKGTDYTLIYSDEASSKVGKYNVTVNFTGKYEGSKTLSYKITK